MGWPYSEIISKYWELFNEGKTPCDGARNTLTFELAVNLRAICNNSPQQLMQIIPIYDGLPQQEWQQTIVNATKQPMKGMPYRMGKVLEALRTEKKRVMPFAMST
jgi:hypothetical protein